MIVFIGFMGSGKTTVGKLVAKHLSLPFVDTDQLISEKYGAISQIFADHGEEYFRKVESETITAVLVGQEAVVSLGGGAVTIPAVRKALVGHQVIWLRINMTTALSRLVGDDTRPLLQDSSLKQRFVARQPLYAKVSTHEIWVTNHATNRVARMALEALGYSDPDPLD